MNNQPDFSYVSYTERKKNDSPTPRCVAGEESTFKQTIHTRKFRELSAYFTLCFFSFTTFITAYITKNMPNTRSLAGAEGKTVNLFLYPTAVDTAHDRSFTVFPKITAPENKRIGSVLITLSFNPQAMQISSLEKDNLDSTLSFLKGSSIIDANRTGKIRMFIGAADPQNAPRKVVNLPSVSFFSTAPAVQSSGSITIDGTESEVVFINGEPAEIEISSLTTVD